MALYVLLLTYAKFKDSVFRVSADGEQQVIIGPRFLPELRKLPDSVLSFPKAVELVKLELSVENKH